MMQMTKRPKRGKRQLAAATAFPSCLILLAATAVLAAPPAPTAPGKIEMHKIKLVEGTDPQFEAEMRSALERQDRKDGTQANDLAKIRFERRSMQRQGYITASPATINTHAETITSRYIVERGEVEALLAFDPRAFHLGYEIAGVLYDLSDDDRVHDLTTLIVHPTFGTVRIWENSFATEPRGRMSRYLYGPKFDLEVNGSPALLSVYRTPEGTRGTSELTVLTGTRLYGVGVGVALLPEDPRYRELFDLAALL